MAESYGVDLPASTKPDLESFTRDRWHVVFDVGHERLSVSSRYDDEGVLSVDRSLVAPAPEDAPHPASRA